MIEKVTAYKSSDGKTFEKIDDVQKHELEQILIGLNKVTTDLDNPGNSQIQIDVAARGIVDAADKVIDILTTTARSHSKARKINGGRKTRTPKPAVTIAA